MLVRWGEIRKQNTEIKGPLQLGSMAPIVQWGRLQIQTTLETKLIIYYILYYL